MRAAALRSPESGRRRRFTASGPSPRAIGGEPRRALARPLLLGLFQLLALAAYSSPASAGSGPGADLRAESVAGTFYPSDPAELERAVGYFLADALIRPVADPVAVLAPHAGYVYSGQIAADAYKQVERGDFETVVVLGTNHTTAPFTGGAIWARGAFRTPLGEVAIDEAFSSRLMAADGRFSFRKDAHEKEHSVEVQLPFIQTLFPRAKLVPIVIGSEDPDLCRSLGETIAEAASGRRVLLVASSDLTHYPEGRDAERIDRRVLDAIASGDDAEVRRTIGEEMSAGTAGLSTCACGEAPILTMMAAARAMGAPRGVVVSSAHSGETAFGDARRVVGYGAVVFGRGEAPADPPGREGRRAAPDGAALTGEERRFLLSHARRAIEQYLFSRTPPLSRPDDSALYVARGAFVTLKKSGQLRGCIGHMAEDLPLCRVVGSMALRAAFQDPRFEPLAAEEWKDVELEISVLTPSRPIRDPDEIVPGRDGVVLQKGGKSAVFLPQVATEQGWSREEMLDHLSRKAGLPAGAWKEGATFSVFQAEVFSEKDVE